MTFRTSNEIYPYPYHNGVPLTFKEPSDEQINSVSSKILEKAETKKKKESILCKNCGNEITTADYSIAVGGQHAHIFTNPLGMTFHIGCFSRAWGCFVYGLPTYEATWFPTFTWSIAVCANCFTHLGWYYQSGKESFYGLIMANLARDNRIQ